jgi:hypothetical protein
MAFSLLKTMYLERSGRVSLRKLASEVQNHHLCQKIKSGGSWSLHYGKIKRGSELNFILITKVNMVV